MQGLLPIIKHNSGCDFHRVVNPLKYMDFDISTIPRKSTADILKETKLLFFNRTPENDYDKVLEYQKKYGFKICMDLDDYWQLNVKHPLYPTWIKNKMGEDIVRWMKVADYVTVTTKRLADKVMEFNKNVMVIPNGLPFGEGQFTDLRTESNFTRFVYTGGESHTWDVALLRNVMPRTRSLPMAQFVLAGYQPLNPKAWAKMDSVFKLAKNYERQNFRPLDNYMSAYRDADVCIIPLESNTFNPYKSNLKFLEAGCKNIPVICSMNPPYSDDPYPESIMFAKNTKDWLYWIKYCYDNPEFVKQDGLKLGEYVREHYDLRIINETRKQLFEHLMS